MPVNEKQDRNTSRKAEGIPNGGLHYKVTVSSWERFNPSGL